jgi:pyruvate, water dikinase
LPFTDDISVVVASNGFASGRVCIVFGSGDFQKVKDGDVIVASMTRPEFAPILKKAAAIVTNEGGVTCHTAIVSRELNIPCIIGTQNATRVLHDGDLVKVDADKGVVRVLERVTERQG